MNAHARIPRRCFYGDAGNQIIKWLAVPDPGRRALADGERDLGVFILPPFQRAPVWTITQKTRWIESIYKGLPLPALVWNRTSSPNPCDGWLLDGQQRMGAIVDYVSGDLPLDGWHYTELPEDDRVHFDRMAIPVVATDIPDVDACRDIYERLAYGGTAHALQPLEPSP